MESGAPSLPLFDAVKACMDDPERGLKCAFGDIECIRKTECAAEWAACISDVGP